MGARRFRVALGVELEVCDAFQIIPLLQMLIDPTIDISPLFAGIATAVLYLVSLVVMAEALRTFVTDERRTLPWL